MELSKCGSSSLSNRPSEIANDPSRVHKPPQKFSASWECWDSLTKPGRLGQEVGADALISFRRDTNRAHDRPSSDGSDNGNIGATTRARVGNLTSGRCFNRGSDCLLPWLSYRYRIMRVQIMQDNTTVNAIVEYLDFFHQAFLIIDR